MLKSLKIHELYEEYNIDLKFDKDLTLLVNNNGTFKTSILDIIDSISKGNIGHLLKYNFDSLILKYTNRNLLCTFEMKKKKFAYDMVYVVNFKALKGNELFYDSEGILNIESEIKLPNSDVTKSVVMEKSNQYPLPSLREITLGLKKIPIKINYIPAKRLDDIYTNRKVVYIQQEILRIVNLIRNKKDDFMNEFKSAVVNDLFNFHSSDDLEPLSQETVDSLNSLKNIISEYNIDSKKYTEYVEQITLLHKRSNHFLKSDKSNEQSDSTDGMQEYVKLLKSSSQISMINKIVPKILDWNHISDEMNKPLKEMVNTLNEFFSYNKNIKFEISDNGLNYYRKIKGDFRSIPMERLSSGELQLITILVNAYLDDISTVSVIMIDEPELSMHIEWQSNLLSFLNQLPQKYQIICSSHSPFITNDYWDKIITNFVQEDDYGL